ncbi:MAG TPA: tRNA guanosine(34) transglycosylase Tgt [Pyrinomonadaceae bacterium]|nr:tRNA guanosine(34) transglycosylase Tgt [Pyrinomonadaceae bacterium]
MNAPTEWNLTAQDGNARAGVIQTRRSTIETPVFMPVGTQAAVKGVRFEWLEGELDARIILGNTYHLFLRPGLETMRKLGGLHQFASWNRSFLTDSGGFQVFSLSDLRRLTEEGVEFRSHIDGSLHFLSPEVSMDAQAVLGSEIVMAFDECPPGSVSRDEARRSLELTARWAARSKKRFVQLQETGPDTGSYSYDLTGSEKARLSGRQALFGIIQGAGFTDLRAESLNRTVEIGFDGYAIGGLSVGEEKSVMYSVLADVAPKMPDESPRYLMGVGSPEDLLEAVSHGVDMFDCVMPTRNGRTGGAFTSIGKINIRNAKYTEDESPLDTSCECSVCRRYSRAYIRHLYQAGEMGAATLISHHNLAFYLDTMKQVRQSIKSRTFDRFKNEFLNKLKDNESPDS